MCYKSIQSGSQGLITQALGAGKRQENNDGNVRCHGVPAASPDFTRVELSLFEPIWWQTSPAYLSQKSGQQ